MWARWWMLLVLYELDIYVPQKSGMFPARILELQGKIVNRIDHTFSKAGLCDGKNVHFVNGK